MADPSLLEKLAQLVHASLRPLPPRFGDGRYNSDISPETIKTGIIKDLASQATRIPEDIDILVNAIAVLFRNGLQDDSKFFVSLSLFLLLKCFRWKRLYNSFRHSQVLLLCKLKSPMVLSPICGMSFFILLFRTLVIFISIVLLMVLTMYAHFSLILISEYHVSSSWEVRHRVCQKRETSTSATWCAAGSRSTLRWYP